MINSDFYFYKSAIWIQSFWKNSVNDLCLWAWALVVVWGSFSLCSHCSSGSYFYELFGIFIHLWCFYRILFVSRKQDKGFQLLYSSVFAHVFNRSLKAKLFYWLVDWKCRQVSFTPEPFCYWVISVFNPVISATESRLFLMQWFLLQSYVCF